MGWISAKLAMAAALALLLTNVPVEAKSLRLNITADPSQMDPITESELIAGDIIRNMYEDLAGIDKDGKVIPVLATEWQAIDSGKTWRFKLRQGVKFHSGREFKAADVKRSFEALLTPGPANGDRRANIIEQVAHLLSSENVPRLLEGIVAFDESGEVRTLYPTDGAPPSRTCSSQSTPCAFSMLTCWVMARIGS